MFGRTVICICNDQPHDNPRLRKPYHPTTETYSNEKDYDMDFTQTESETKQQNETLNKSENQPQNNNSSKENNSEENKHKNVPHIRQKQNCHNPEYTMDTLAPETNDENYPPISNSTNKQKQTSTAEQKLTQKPPTVSAP